MARSNSAKSDSPAAEPLSPGAEAIADDGTDGAPVPELEQIELRAWRSFLVAHARVARQLEADLLAASDLPLAEFDVLMQLDLAEDDRLRMNDLADKVVLSRAGITRLVDRLVGDGLVARAKCASDARGSFAVLTEKGRARLDGARPGHFAAVRLRFLDTFSRPELESLAVLLDRPFPRA